MMSIVYLICCMYIIFFSWEHLCDLDLADLKQFDRKEWLALSSFFLGMVFAPITVFAIAVAHAFQKIDRTMDKRVSNILYDWETNAALIANVPRYQLRDDKYNYYINIREAARNIKDSDLKIISYMDRNGRFDQELINTALDELVERALFKTGKK